MILKGISSGGNSFFCINQCQVGNTTKDYYMKLWNIDNKN